MGDTTLVVIGDLAREVENRLGSRHLDGLSIGRRVIHPAGGVLFDFGHVVGLLYLSCGISLAQRSRIGRISSALAGGRRTFIRATPRSRYRFKRSGSSGAPRSEEHTSELQSRENL